MRHSRPVTVQDFAGGADGLVEPGIGRGRIAERGFRRGREGHTAILGPWFEVRSIGVIHRLCPRWLKPARAARKDRAEPNFARGFPLQD